MNFSNLNLVRKLGWAYAIMFFITASLAYIPGLTDENGILFGLFSLELHDDILHAASGVWAAWAAWASTRASIFFFKTFGILYGLDGVLGLITSQGYLDGGIFLHPDEKYDLATRIGANLPHILIGGIAIYVGFVLSRKFVEPS